MRALRSLFVVFVALGVLGVSSLAEAQTQDERNRARQLYTEAQALFEAGNHAQAEASFRAAYSAVPSPVVLKAVAAAQEHQGNISGAIETLEQYLREAPQAQDRAQVEQQLAGLRARPAVVAISSTPPGAEIWVDGRDTGHTTPHDVEMRGGEHTVELRMAGHSPIQQTFTSRPGTRVRLEMNLSAGGDPLGSEGGDGQGAGGGGGDGGGGSSDPSAAVWIFAGVGAAGLVSGTVFGFLALSEQSNFDQEPSNDAADRGETFALVADISFGVAAAGAITAIVLYIVERADGDGDSASTTTVAPWASQTGGGVAAQVRF